MDSDSYVSLYVQVLPSSKEHFVAWQALIDEITLISSLVELLDKLDRELREELDEEELKEELLALFELTPCDPTNVRLAEARTPSSVFPSATPSSEAEPEVLPPALVAPPLRTSNGSTSPPPEAPDTSDFKDDRELPLAESTVSAAPNELLGAELDVPCAELALTLPDALTPDA